MAAQFEEWLQSNDLALAIPIHADVAGRGLWQSIVTALTSALDHFRV